jgi:hypothetical protein
MEEFTDGTGQVLKVHAKEKCNGDRPCPIHNPSPHYMVNWPLHWRDDKRIFERMCPHGVGHPDPDTLSYVELKRGEEETYYKSIHGCDGCCKGD